MLPDEDKASGPTNTSAVNNRVYELVRAFYYAREEENKFHVDALSNARAILPLLPQISAGERESLFDKNPQLFFVLIVEWMKGQNSKLFQELQKMPDHIKALFAKADQELRTKTIPQLVGDTLDGVFSLGAKVIGEFYRKVVKIGADIVK